MYSDVVWSVIYMVALLLTGTGWVIYYIMRLAYIETREGETTVTYPIVGSLVSESTGERTPDGRDNDPAYAELAIGANQNPA